MNLWIPGMGNTNSKAYLVDRAVNAYDERLMFARNEDTGDWCIFIRLPRPSDPYPVIGFQDRIPEPVEAIDRLKAADTMRVGEQIYREVVKSQEDYRKKFEYASDEASAESSEVVEHLMRKHGKSPIIKSFSKGVSDNDAG
jgi:hypothetical protein